MRPVKHKRCFYDIETYPNLLSFKFKDYETKEKRTFIIYYCPEDESKSINQFEQLCDYVIKYVQWLIGYNSIGFDDVITKALISNKTLYSSMNTSVVAQAMYSLAQSIIDSQKTNKTPPEVYFAKNKNYYYSLDLLLLFNPIDRVSLKQLAINLHWPLLQDLPYPHYTMLTEKQMQEVLNYQDNDVEITERVFDYLQEEINDRVLFSKKLNLDFTNSCSTEIAKLTIQKYYEEATGIPPEIFTKLRTKYDKINLIDCISKKVRFITKKYNKILEAIEKKVVDPNIDENSKKKKQFEYILSSKYLTHTMALGGVHSNNPPEIISENEKYWLIDIDVDSFYPFLLINEKLFPRHLGEVFLSIYKSKIVDDRIQAKRIGDKVMALLLKYSANATYGLTKSIHSWLYDPKVTISTCVSGQLLLFMLMEALELYTNCIVIYSNTDGLTIKVPKNEFNLFEEICNRWKAYTNLSLEVNYYEKMVMRDVNNYIIFTKKKGKERIKAKGAYLYNKRVTQGYNFPIVALAVQEYFDKGTPVETTVYSGDSIYDYMKAEKSAPNMKAVFYEKFTNNAIELQKSNRWIVTKDNKGEGKLIKVNTENGDRTNMQKGRMVTIYNNVPVTGLAEVKIDYDFYIEEAYKLINIKDSFKETHIPELIQATLF